MKVVKFKLFTTLLSGIVVSLSLINSGEDANIWTPG